MDALLFLHITGAVLFVGNIVTAAFWKIRADVGGDPAAMHGAAKNVMLADFAFTLPGIILVIATGNAMAVRAGMPLSEFNWLTLSLALFSLTGVIWAALLLPIQRSMIRHAARSVEFGAATAEYRRASLYWAIFGTVATLLPFVVLYLMVAKPI